MAQYSRVSVNQPPASLFNNFLFHRILFVPEMFTLCRDSFVGIVIFVLSVFFLCPFSTSSTVSFYLHNDIPYKYIGVNLEGYLMQLYRYGGV